MNMPFILGMYHHLKQSNMITGTEKLNIKDEDIVFQGTMKMPDDYPIDIFPNDVIPEDTFPLNINEDLEFSVPINNSEEIEFPGYSDSLEDLL